eukprot:9482349-Pyramimonas_sp.AAC.1
MALRKYSGLCRRSSYVDSRCLKSKKWASGTIPDRQDAAVRWIRGVDIHRSMFWHASGPSTDVFHRGSSLNGNEPL